jgi:hypothetical protein
MQKSIVNKSGRNASPTPAQQEARPKRTKKARVWKLQFTNGENGKPSSKITKDTSGIQLTNTKVEGAKPILFPMTEVPDNAKIKLTAMALGVMARKIAQHAGDQDPGEAVQEFLTKVAQDDFVTATAKGAGSRGRPFDAALYTDAMARFVKMVDNKVMSNEEKEVYKDKISNMQVELRRKYFAQFTKSAEFNRAMAEVKVERARAVKGDKTTNQELLKKMLEI